MHRKLAAIVILAPMFAFALIPAYAQVAPQATQGGIPLTVGGGVSDYSLDWGPGRRMIGITGWADWRLPFRERYLSGLGVEVEGREIDWDKPSDLPKMRQETGLGGPIYILPLHSRRYHLYAKYLVGYGGIYFTSGNPYYTHDTRIIFAPGGGIDYRVWHGLSVRADYEYQFWHQIFGSHDLNPNGPTVGMVYSFGGRRYE
jgi:opacity protein-like surface antigen